MTTKDRAANKLINEKSPYLLQHAHNPVNWYPWGEEAFHKAKAEDKPMFLSVGYSTCHWCHVMAHESFEDDRAAELLNREFIAIKVDREERPDVDAVYMAVCQALTGSGGWPLTIIMTPEQKPFYAGTYLPKNSRYGMTGLMELLEEVSRQWKTDRGKLLTSGDEITAFMQKHAPDRNRAERGKGELLNKAPRFFARSFDKDWGGFGDAPKFPAPHNLIYLMRYSVSGQDDYALLMAERTLEHMFRGGIFDHIGGGFSRYSTDKKWLIPHFEKMLYDNALLVIAYLEAFQITCRPLYRSVAQKTLDYVLEELTDPEGGFYCGQDADSEGVEGKYYAFTQKEIIEVLGEVDGALFCSWFGITESGNFEGKSIPNLLDNPRFEEDDPVISALCRKLYKYRLKRTRLHKDDKVLTAWNALMITALSKAGHILDEPRYLQAARRAQRFISNSLTDGSGRLLRRWKDGEAAHNGQLEDYAFYGLALLALYGATFDPEYLSAAADISERMCLFFLDSKNGGFYIYANDAEKLITRPKDIYDGALPSGNAAAALLLTRLAGLTGEEAWRKASDLQISFVTGAIGDYPLGNSVSLLALMEIYYPSRELLCVTAGQKAPEELIALLREKMIPNLTVMIKTPDNQRQLASAAPFTAAYPFPAEGTRYYLCSGKTCSAPARDISELQKLLSET